MLSGNGSQEAIVDPCSHRTHAAPRWNPGSHRARSCGALASSLHKSFPVRFVPHGLLDRLAREN